MSTGVNSFNFLEIQDEVSHSIFIFLCTVICKIKMLERDDSIERVAKNNGREFGKVL